ncbi:branched-chain alpha-keto dehydrogenase complex dihydrolipoyllysine-residue (2-methylpropanoyl)transferase [soil metagenome]
MADTKQGTQVTMPKLGESVTEGTLGSWLKKIGDRVEKYEPMVEVVTDKVTAEIPAPVSGVLTEILSGEGLTIPVGTPICVIDTGEGASAPATVDPTPAGVEDTEPAAEIGDAVASGQIPESNGKARPVDGDETSARGNRDEVALLQSRSSPLVRRLAAEHDIDIASVDGSGVGGRVTKSDIETAISTQDAAQPVEVPETVTQPSAAPQTQPLAAPLAVPLMPGDEVVEAGQMRKQIADHMVRSVQTAPHVTVWMETDMSNIVAARAANKEQFQQREGFELTFMPFVLHVLVQTLREHPEMNAAWDNGKIVRRKALNIGIAVSLEDGLIVPIIKNADEKSLVGLARSVRDLAKRARSNQLQPDDITGGTFTLNNPGTFGTLMSTPIIVQPQAGILSIEAIMKRPVVVDDAIAIRPMMNLSLSIDHRILDGLSAARFLGTMKRGLESFPVEGSI